MALPTLQPYWMKHYKSRAEGIHVRRTQHEADFRDKWNHNARYFQRSDVETTKQRAWGSKESYQQSMDALNSRFNEDSKKNRIDERRKELAALLLKEKTLYEEEMKEKRLGGAGSLLQMKDRVDNLKSAREEKRKQIAEEKLLEHWKRNAPELREIEAEQHKKFVVNSWVDQKQEKEEGLKTARDEDRRLEAHMERERMLALQKEKERAELKKREEIAVAQELREQMEQLKIQEEEAMMLKHEQDLLNQQQQRIDRAQEERKELEERRKRQELGRVLIRQHKAQMKRKSQQIQEALELDLKILQDLAQKEEKDKELQTARREKARNDADYMRKVVEDQLRLEKAREAELDDMYRDEAARVWQKREAEWERERLARERLMQDVLEERKGQIVAKMEENRCKQEESLENREELLREMEAVNVMTAREKKEAEEQKVKRDEEMREQLTERRNRVREARIREEQELQKLREEEEAYERMLREEASRMKARQPQGQFHPRRRPNQAW